MKGSRWDALLELIVNFGLVGTVSASGPNLFYLTVCAAGKPEVPMLSVTKKAENFRLRPMNRIETCGEPKTSHLDPESISGPDGRMF